MPHCACLMNCLALCMQSCERRARRRAWVDRYAAAVIAVAVNNFLRVALALSPYVSPVDRGRELRDRWSASSRLSSTSRSTSSDLIFLGHVRTQWRPSSGGRGASEVRELFSFRVASMFARARQTAVHSAAPGPAARLIAAASECAPVALHRRSIAVNSLLPNFR